MKEGLLKMIDIKLTGLNVTISGEKILKDIDFTLAENDSVGIVGESGSGKTMLVRSITGLLPAGADIAGDYEISGRPFELRAKERAWRTVRGRLIGMVMQDPFTALDPMTKCGKQIEAGVPKQERKLFDIEKALGEVGLSPEAASRYPFELSGGMRQRVVIAAALATKPGALIADEATTALDVITQREILDLIDTIRAKRSMPFIMITHDIRLVSERTRRIIVIRDGEIVEQGATTDVIANPRSEYTKLLIAPLSATASSQTPDGTATPVSAVAPGSAASPILSATGVTKNFGGFVAVEDVTMRVAPGEIVGVVGQSGSGKTTLARCIVGLEKPDAGSIAYAGAGAPQIVFQDPYSSLNPAHTVEFILKEALKVSGRDASDLDSIMKLAEIPAELLSRKPAQLSGGQRQRVAIARALAPAPELLICDESVSALDILTQNQILATIRKLCLEKNLAILFITHDLSVVRALASRIYVMNKARVVEEGPTEEVFTNTKDEYTKALIAASEYGIKEQAAKLDAAAGLSPVSEPPAAVGLSPVPEQPKKTGPGPVSEPPTPSVPPLPALFTNARIYTVAGAGWEHRPAQAMAVGKDGRILSVGSEAEARAAMGAYLPSYRIIDLEGRAVLPGFIDTHVHMPGDALTKLFQIYLYDSRGLDNTLDIIRDFVKAHPDRDIYFGTGFYLSIAGGNPEGPRREWLDEIEPEKPIVLESSDGHSLWMNTAAFRHFGIDKDTPAPTGGILHRDAETGELSGTLTDAHVLIGARPEYTIAQAEQAVTLYQQKMLTWGYTAAMHIAPQFCDPEALRRLHERGEWKMRVNMCALADHDADIPAVRAAFDEAKKYEEYFAGSELIKTTTVKFFADGVVEGRTAYLKEPYTQTNEGEPEGYRSEPLWDKDELADAFGEVMDAGYQIHVHSIGDAATADTVYALEKAVASPRRAGAGKPKRRDTITHLQLVSPGDIDKVQELGVIASFQPFWHFKEPGWYDQIDLAVLGAERAEAAYPVGTAVRKGIRVTFSGDYPVSSNNDPFSAIQIAVTRNLGNPGPYGEPPLASKDDPKWLRNPNERISLAEAIEAYTINGAWQLFREDEIGSLEAGKRADFIVLNADPFLTADEELYSLHPQQVYISGTNVLPDAPCFE
ncbi:MAG: amidohydrolase family protein [Clostridiales Family XIII bacterium]|nr:amidohydrolase family protein [Clostridiales Family XIII bacterium]